MEEFGRENSNSIFEVVKLIFVKIGIYKKKKKKKKKKLEKKVWNFSNYKREQRLKKFENLRILKI